MGTKRVNPLPLGRAMDLKQIKKQFGDTSISLGISGSREGFSVSQKETFLKILSELSLKEFHHGDCCGVDEESHDLVREALPNVNILIHPPEDDKHRAYQFDKDTELYDPKPYLNRNRDIVKSSDLMVIVPNGPEYRNKRSGTWYTYRYAKKSKVPYAVLDWCGDGIRVI